MESKNEKSNLIIFLLFICFIVFLQIDNKPKNVIIIKKKISPTKKPMKIIHRRKVLPTTRPIINTAGISIGNSCSSHSGGISASPY